MGIELEYCDQLGNRITTIDDWIEITYNKVLGGIGNGRVTVPFNRTGKWNPQTVRRAYHDKKKDRRIHVYIIPTSQSGQRLGRFLDMVIFLDWFQIKEDREGKERLVLRGHCPNGLLGRREIAYYEGSSESDKSGTSDNLMKGLVRENMGNLSGTDYDGNTVIRDLSSFGFSVQANSTSGPTLSSRVFAWGNLLKTLKNIQAESATQDNETFFQVINKTAKNLEFQTYQDLPGRDRSQGSNAIVFSKSNGNLKNAEYTEDYRNEKNVIYGAGRGRDSNLIVKEATNQNSIDRSVWGRKEMYVPAGNDDIQSIADSKVRETRAKSTIGGEIIATFDTPYAPRGWLLGDKVIVDYHATSRPIIKNVKIEAKRDADLGVIKEKITSRIEAIIND